MIPDPWNKSATVVLYFLLCLCALLGAAYEGGAY